MKDFMYRDLHDHPKLALCPHPVSLCGEAPGAKTQRGGANRAEARPAEAQRH